MLNPRSLIGAFSVLGLLPGCSGTSEPEPEPEAPPTVVDTEEPPHVCSFPAMAGEWSGDCCGDGGITAPQTLTLQETASENESIGSTVLTPPEGIEFIDTGGNVIEYGPCSFDLVCVPPSPDGDDAVYAIQDPVRDWCINGYYKLRLIDADTLEITEQQLWSSPTSTTWTLTRTSP